MGFLEPSPPPFDVEEWKRKPHLARIKPLVQDWGVHGFGSPTFVFLLYAVKLVIWVIGAFAVISLTPGIGSLTDFKGCGTEPIFFQKLAVGAMLWEILGLGAGSMPLTFRFKPLIGGPLYWLRPGAIRLPPRAGKVPGAHGSTRTLLDVGLSAGVLASAVFLLASGGQDAVGGAVGRLNETGIVVLLGFLGLLGLRDKVSFL